MRRPTTWVALVIPVVVAGLALAYLATAVPSRQSIPVIPRVTYTLPVSYTGLDYYNPTNFFTNCPDISWLQPQCYDSSRGGISSSNLLASDLGFISENHLGSFLRVWVSLDQLMNWNSQTGFVSFNPGAMADLDRSLAQFASHHVKVDLVLYVYARGSRSIHQFHPEALDGDHPAMRSNYLRALSEFIEHVKSNPVDSSTVTVMDLQTEAYYQLEQYFDRPSRLGTFTACTTSTGIVESSCVDQQIIHPWLESLYRTAHRADPHMFYTIADTGRLLTRNWTTQRYWLSMYPVDVYDIHMYDDRPWAHTARWATAKNLPKPWFSGETGCGSGNKACTYSGVRSLRIDRWWLDHLRHYGASAVLIENHVTLWTYPNGAASQSLTPTGQALKCASDPRAGVCSSN